MMESERALQAAANEALAAATGECLRRFDTDGSPITAGGRKMTTRGQKPKTYQSPYGPVRIGRHVYQSSAGGRTFAPLDCAARIMRTATPLMARQTACKYAHGDASAAVADFAGHGRSVARTYVRELGRDVACVAAEKEGRWSYAVEPGEEVHTVSVGVDGACALMLEDGWRQVMAGTIALYNRDGGRLHTTYVAAAPEYGKGTFFERMDRELAAVKRACPGARYTGVADGAADHWPWLSANTTWQTVDFWHAAEYLNGASEAMAAGVAGTTAEAWAQGACHRLKHGKGAAASLAREMRRKLKGGVRRKAHREALERAAGYLANNADRMRYNVYRAMGLPIGSGVTEAACKTVVKERLCGSGMRWDTKGAAEVLCLRTMVKTPGRWDAFWGKVGRHGFAKITTPQRPRKD